MINSLLGFISCFMFIAVLLLVSTLYSRIHWLFKASLITTSLAFTYLLYTSFWPLLGWPTSDISNNTVRMVWAETLEPDPHTGFAGIVYLWYTEVDADIPRAGMLPFSKDEEEAMEKGKQMVAKGIPVYLKKKGSGDGQSGAVAADGGKNASGSSGQSQGAEQSSGQSSGGESKGGEAVMEFIAPPSTAPVKQQ